MSSVVFIHGLWLAKESWESWRGLFEEQGYETSAPGWPGEGDSIEVTRDDPAAQAGIGIADIVDHYAKLLPSAEQRPVVVAHSFGGLIAQILLDRGLIAGAVAVSPAPIQGVHKLPVAQLRSALPVLKSRKNRDRAKALTRRQFRYGFGNAVSASVSDSLWRRWSIPSPGRPLFEVASANRQAASPAKVNTQNSARGPLLFIAAGRDHTVPEATTRAAYELHSSSRAVTELRVFPDRGHSLAIDPEWRAVADSVLQWLGAQDLDE